MGRAAALAVALCAALLTPGAANAQWPWRGLDPGPHPVGYRVVREYDRSRTALPTAASSGSSAGELDRLMEVRIWYPAAPAVGARRMPYRGYIELSPDDGPVGPLTDTLRMRGDHGARTAALRLVGDSAAGAARLLDAQTSAVRNAPIAAGRFPAIVYAPGRNDASDDNAVLWEYLASHGYVVTTIPSQGVSTVSVLGGPASTETLVRDMEWALAKLSGMPEVDAARVGAAGFSFGGSTALLLAMRNARVRAVVALDPSFVFERMTSAVTASAFLDTATFSKPVLVSAQRGEEWSSGVIDMLRHAPRFVVRVGGMSHGDFCSYGIAYRSVAPGSARDSTLRRLADSYAGVATYAREFLDAFVKGDAERQQSVRSKPRWRGVNGAEVEFSFRLGIPVQ